MHRPSRLLLMSAGVALTVASVIGTVSAATAAVARSTAVHSTASWAKAAWGTFPTWSRSGDGDDVVALPRSIRAAVAEVHYEGDSNFVIWTLNKRDKEDDLLVNEIGDFSGREAFGLEDAGDARALEIKAEGQWSVTLRPIASAGVLPRSGHGDGVFLMASHRRAHITHDGEDNFIVTQHTGGRGGWNLLVNEIGDYHGTVRLEHGPSVIVVDADGQWTTHVS